jgi:hypothetical protein
LLFNQRNGKAKRELLNILLNYLKAQDVTEKIENYKEAFDFRWMDNDENELLGNVTLLNCLFGTKIYDI